MGEALDDEERAIFQRLTGRPQEPGERLEEFWAVVGRRGGKSRAIAVLSVFIAVFVDHAPVLVVGERPVVLCLAPSQKQAGVVFGYVAGILESTPMLAKLVKSKTAEILALTNGIEIEIRAASFRNVRGVTRLRLSAMRPPSGSMIRAARAIPTRPSSTRCARRWRRRAAYSRSSLRPTPAAARSMRRGSATMARRATRASWSHKAQAATSIRALPQKVVDRAMERDPAAASAEYLGQFRRDLEAFVSHEAVAACIEHGVIERAPDQGRAHVGFVDPSGGSSDAMTLAVAYRDGERVHLAALREVKPPFSPKSTVADFATFLRSYGVAMVRGDRYAGEWPREQFRKHGIEYQPADKTRSELYGELLPLINSGGRRLLDDKRLVSQLVGLERRTSRAGKDSIDHPPGGHDDVANAAAGAIVYARRARPTSRSWCRSSSAESARYFPHSDGLRRRQRRRVTGSAVSRFHNSKGFK